ncbi:MAG TPA: Asp-tRNA(Asn)/Glu-tRNA(Gln) amidotransferase GatCAB subunit C [Opitutae bacterium]|nr:Asp-tRNA(Asn)/Glu-tRNA(Gln) amidotransferase GatCAB subunit C [Opitutae bacterium]|tara:strand:- start:5740 stop:6030 length:291 start_codon:yes stop_codon:yes gene_type:complete
MAEAPHIDIDKVAELARIALTEEEKTKFSSQLESILGYIDKLNELDTTNVEPTAHPHSVENVWREDRATSELPTCEAVKNAPKQRQNMFVVPKVVE